MRKGAIALGVKVTALGAVAVAVSFLVFGARPDGIANFYRDTLTPAGFAVWFSGFIIATLAPPVIAIAFWSGSAGLRYGWLLHILLVPVTYAVVRGAVAIMLLAAGEADSDGLTGWATDPAMLLMLVCPVVYFVVLGITGLSERRRRANRR